MRAASTGRRRATSFATPRSSGPVNGAPPFDQWEPEDLWREYRSNPTELLRNHMLERYLPLVRYNAERIYTRLPDEVDIDDLVQAGIWGLVDAVEGFDLERQVKFETFCAPRIRGAILDHLRSMDWVPRLVRHRSARVDRVRESIRLSQGYTPNEVEISGALGEDGEETKKIIRDGKAASITSLSRQRFHSDGSREVREIDVIEDQRLSNPLSEVQRRDLRNLLTKGLSRAERLIVLLYYYENMTMKDIGATLDLSESRVSQMHSSILLRLRAHMQHREREFEEEE